MTTHSAGCHGWHLDCANARIADLLAERDALAARLDKLLDAIGDPDELRWHRWHCDDTGNGDDLRDLLVRIADAADPDNRSTE